MRVWMKQLFALAITVLISVSAIMTGAYAWENEQQALNDLLEDANTLVTLLKQEKTVDGAISNTVLPNAVFRLYKADGTQLGEQFVTDQNGQIVVKLSPGKYYFEEITPPENFTFDCDASGNAITRYAFEIKEGETSITVNAYNRKKIDETIEISGIKNWVLNGYQGDLPASITVKLMAGTTVVETKEVSPDANGDWVYRFTVPKYRADGVEIAYTVKEEPVDGFVVSYNGYDITNTYTTSVEADFPTITKKVEGENAPKDTFSFVVKGKLGYPMPDGAAGRTLRVSRKGPGKVTPGTITFTEPGDYVYTVYELDGGDDRWEYDLTEYTVTFHVVRSGGKLSCDYTIKKDGRRANQLLFTNVFEEIDLNEKITIKGEKTWNHRDNPEKDWPDHIVVKVYGAGKLVQQRRVSEASDWEYSFTLPKYDVYGDEIDYEIDEAEVPDYTKRISGYDLYNTYSGEPDIPVNPIDPPPVDPTPPDVPDVPPEEPIPPAVDPEQPQKDPNAPKTGEEFNLRFWVILMVSSFLVVLILLLFLLHAPRYQGKRVLKKGKRLAKKQDYRSKK